MSNWIKCSEMMPEPRRTVIIYGMAGIGPMVMEGFWTGEQWTPDGIEFWPPDGWITHWQPLPEPPEVDE